MKYKTTRKEIMSGYKNVISVSYCGLQNLLHYKSPIAYTTRREGWGADIYDVGNNTAIVTGYAPFGNIRADYETCQRFERQAQAKSMGFEFIPHANMLLDSFIQEVTA